MSVKVKLFTVYKTFFLSLKNNIFFNKHTLKYSIVVYNDVVMQQYILLWTKTRDSTFRKRNHGVWLLFFWPRKINIFTTPPSLVFTSTFLSTSYKMHISILYIYMYTWGCKFCFFTFSVKTKYTRDRMFRISVFHKYFLSLFVSPYQSLLIYVSH